MTPMPSDHELLQRFIAADQEAFAVLVARHQGVVRTACARQAAPGDCDDCVQAVFLVLARRPTAARRAGNLPGWLVRTAWFVCRHSRRAAVRRAHAERGAAQCAAVALGSVPSAGTEFEALAQLDDCLQRLPDRQRAAVTLHYLAGHPADEVATMLGVSRDNAYQLLSRGLAGLRRLLARRGVALSAAALGALLGGQAQAAAVSGGGASSTAIITTLSGTPSAATTALAHGAMTAMTIATATPFALAASLLLATGLTTAALTAEHAPVSPPPSTAPTATTVSGNATGRQVDDTAWRRAIEQQLEQEVTLDFQDQDLAEVASFLHKVTNANVVLDPRAIAAAPPPITLKVDRMKLRFVLDFIMKLTSLGYALRDGAIFIAPADVIAPTRPSVAQNVTLTTSGAHLEGAPPAMQQRLDQHVTFDFQDTPTGQVFSFLRQVSGVNIVIDPALAARGGTVTLRVQDMRLADALKWLADLLAVAITVQDGALYVSVPAGAVPEQPAGGQKPQGQGPKTVSPEPVGTAF